MCLASIEPFNDDVWGYGREANHGLKPLLPWYKNDRLKPLLPRYHTSILRNEALF